MKCLSELSYEDLLGSTLICFLKSCDHNID